MQWSLDSFADNDGDLTSLFRSAGISIWTNAAYGDIAASLIKLISTPASEAAGSTKQRAKLESVVTRPREAAEGNSMPGWILGESQRGGRGRGVTGRGFGGQRIHRG